MRTFEGPRNGILLFFEYFFGLFYCFPLGFKADEVVKQVNSSLERLQTDCVDLVYLHSLDRSSDPAPIEETLKGIHQCYQGSLYCFWIKSVW